MPIAPQRLKWQETTRQMDLSPLLLVNSRSLPILLAAALTKKEPPRDGKYFDAQFLALLAGEYPSPSSWLPFHLLPIHRLPGVCCPYMGRERSVLSSLSPVLLYLPLATPA